MIVEVFIGQNNSCVSTLELRRETRDSCVSKRSPKLSPSFALCDLINAKIKVDATGECVQVDGLPLQSPQDSELLSSKATDLRVCD
jgi:hypothetical protein